MAGDNTVTIVMPDGKELEFQPEAWNKLLSSIEEHAGPYFSNGPNDLRQSYNRLIGTQNAVVGETSSNR